MSSASRCRAAVGIFLLWAAGCNRAAPQLSPPVPARPRMLPGCTGRIPISVSAGVAPGFTWAPDCSVSAVAVQVSVRTEARWETVWSFHIPHPGGIGSGIEYGSAPPDAVVTVRARRLRAGRQYLVTVRNVVGSSSIAGEGQVGFRP